MYAALSKDGKNVYACCVEGLEYFLVTAPTKEVMEGIAREVGILEQAQIVPVEHPSVQESLKVMENKPRVYNSLEEFNAMRKSTR